MKQTSALHPIFDHPTIRGVVFDLDGTLINSAGDIMQSMRITFEEMGLGQLPTDYMPDNLHGTCEGIVRHILQDMGWPVPDNMDEVHASYIRNYARLDHLNTRLYPGVMPVLEALSDAGIPMGICTNKIHANALAALKKLGIQDRFAVISGSDSWSAFKPSPVPLLETLRVLGIPPSECLYFGDTSTDQACAHAAGVPFVLFESGYGDTALDRSAAHFSFTHWEDLSAGMPIDA